ncbi:serine/threonine protein kinase [Streptomyces sp. IMTB 2501]|uniref:serine/threonine-protein kinase n=1 Tax=Streptomyces sp. IMTB 2501 TaxID=1776340 RepID=UPI00096F7B3F|nr:serine/threonine-protein kinase [Streptomyces sp. IMTB 2501]OLZ65066.1 serine/threonine protein kinase [Streptomyces sp. IMTB 2501]
MNGEHNGVEPLEGDDPRRIGPIPLVGRLGAGGMGRVYLGVHEGRYAAVKQVLPSVVGEDKDFVRRFGHELDNLSRLPAGATAPLLAGDRDARPPWFATAYVPGLTLREAVEAHGGPLPAESLWLLLRQAAQGLAAVHGLDMVHRDVKPSNVMLTLDGITLIDFGVARAAEQSQLTRTGMVVGTPAYMSPEQASGARRLTGAVDVFALGSVVAYAGCGQPPFGDESGHGVLYRIVHEQPGLDELRSVDAELAAVVASCLDKDPEGRPTAAELLELTAGHAPSSGAPLWPTVITERLAARAEFAAQVPEVEDRTLPASGGTAGPEPQGAAGPESEPQVVVRPGAGRPERERRRRRLLVAVVPIVVGAGVATLAFQLAPYTTGTHHDGAAGTPGPSVSASTGATPGGSSASPSGEPTPGKNGSASPANGKKKDGQDGKGGTNGKNGKNGDSKTDPQGTDGSGTGSTGTAGTGGNSAGGGPGSGSDGSGGSGTSGGASGSGGGSGGSSGGGSGPGSGTFRLKNGENGKCLTQVYGSTGLGSCSDSTARWTFRSAAGGSVKVVNVSTGSCLSSNGNGQAVFVGDCSQSGSNLRWATGSGDSLRTVYDGGCLDLAFGGGVAEASCQSGASSQSWART